MQPITMGASTSRRPASRRSKQQVTGEVLCVGDAVPPNGRVAVSARLNSALANDVLTTYLPSTTCV